MALRGEAFRHQDGRLTQRIILGGKSYFIKQHTGIGWKEIFKNLFQGRWPVFSAKNEWRAIERLKSAGIAVPTIVGYGQRGLNPANIKSFVLMEELTSTISLEELCYQWEKKPPSFLLKKKLILEVAEIARTMHAMGMNHRDFYICHFLLSDVIYAVMPAKADIHFDTVMPAKAGTQEKKNFLYLIDLHRAQVRKKVPKRWSIKDLAGLYFSSKKGGLTQRDLLRFIRKYRAKSLREILENESDYWQKVKNRGEQLYREHNQ